MDDAAPTDQSQAHSPRRHWRWPITRIARAALLYGAGHSLDEIAKDPLIAGSVGGVRRALKRSGINVDDRPAARVMAVRVPHAATPVLAEAAAARRMLPEQLAALLLKTLAEEPTLIGNVLDDGR